MSPATGQCQVCSDGTNTRCSRCKIAYYCSSEHSVSDWPRHKRDCKILAAVKSQVRFPHRVKAVLFPVEGGEPRVVEVLYKPVESRTGMPSIPSHLPDLTPFLGNATPWPVRIQMDGLKSGSRPLGRTLTVYHNDNFLAEKCPLNKCIADLTGGTGYKWADNLIGFRNTTTPMLFDDIKEDDIRVMKKYFTDGGDGNDAFDPQTKRNMAAMMGPDALNLTLGRGNN